MSNIHYFIFTKQLICKIKYKLRVHDDIVLLIIRSKKKNIPTYVFLNNILIQVLKYT